MNLSILTLLILNELCSLAVGFSFLNISFDHNIDLEMIKSINYYSKASYCKAIKLQDWSCGEECKYHDKMSHIRVFNNKDMKSQGYCGYNKKLNEIVLAFRGSSHLQNWESVIQIFPQLYKDCNKCYVHYGFMQHSETVIQNSTDCVKILLKSYPTAKIIITGHSLGGVTASLVSLEIAKAIKDPNIIRLVTFGSPRIGNIQFAEHLQRIIQNQQRIVNLNDIVPHLPPQNKLFNYMHSGTEIWLNDEKYHSSYKVCEAKNKESDDCSNQVMPFKYSGVDHTKYFGIYTGCTSDNLKINKLEEENTSSLSFFLNFKQSKQDKNITINQMMDD